MRRFWTFLSSVISRMAATSTVAGASVMLLDGATDVTPGYPTLSSMSSMARFPWVWTCVRAVAGDAAGLPLVAVRRQASGARRMERTFVSDAGLDLLARPSPGVTGHLFRKQLLVDYLLTGNSYAWRPSESLIYRLHPAHVTPQVDGFEIVAYKWANPETGTHQILPASQVLHTRDVSWSDDRSSVLGESAIRPLHDDLLIEMGAKALAAFQAQKGRPDVLFSTTEPVGDIVAQKLKDRWRDATISKDGAFVTGGDVKATVLSWSPEVFQYAERSAVVRDEVLAVFEVPPARAGISTANYGTEKQQTRTYWESVRRRIRAFDDSFSLLAAPGVRIEHDFQDVEALQVSFTERIRQATDLVALGATPADACAYVGMEDAPVPDVAPADFSRPDNIDKRPEEPQEDRAALAGELAAYLAESEPRYAEMAAAAERGAEMGLALRWETERLFAALDRHLAPTDARYWAEEIAGATLEGARIAKDDADVLGRLFGPERAQRTADLMRRREVA